MNIMHEHDGFAWMRCHLEAERRRIEDYRQAARIYGALAAQAECNVAEWAAMITNAEAAATPPTMPAAPVPAGMVAS